MYTFWRFPLACAKYPAKSGENLQYYFFPINLLVVSHRRSLCLREFKGFQGLGLVFLSYDANFLTQNRVTHFLKIDRE